MEFDKVVPTRKNELSVFSVILGEINQAIRQIFRRGKVIGGDEILIIYNPLKNRSLQDHRDN